MCARDTVSQSSFFFFTSRNHVTVCERAANAAPKTSPVQLATIGPIVSDYGLYSAVGLFHTSVLRESPRGTLCKGGGARLDGRAERSLTCVPVMGSLSCARTRTHARTESHRQPTNGRKLQSVCAAASLCVCRLRFPARLPA